MVAMRMSLFVLFVNMMLISSADSATSNSGQLTVFAQSSLSSGSCGLVGLKKSAPESIKKYYASVSALDSSVLSGCGRCMEISCADEKAKCQKQVTAYVIDVCKGCKKGEVRVSKDTSTQLLNGAAATQTTAVNWKFIQCPDSFLSGKNIQACIGPGASQHWMSFQPYNFKKPVTKVVVNGVEGKAKADQFVFSISFTTPAKGKWYENVAVEFHSNSEVKKDTITFASAGKEGCTTSKVQFSDSADEQEGGSTGSSSSSSSLILPIILAVVGVILIAIVGFFIYRRRKNSAAALNSRSSQSFNDSDAPVPAFAVATSNIKIESPTYTNSKVLKKSEHSPTPHIVQKVSSENDSRNTTSSYADNEYSSEYGHENNYRNSYLSDSNSSIAANGFSAAAATTRNTQGNDRGVEEHQSSPVGSAPYAIVHNSPKKTAHNVVEAQRPSAFGRFKSMFSSDRKSSFDVDDVRQSVNIDKPPQRESTLERDSYAANAITSPVGSRPSLISSRGGTSVRGSTRFSSNAAAVQRQSSYGSNDDISSTYMSHSSSTVDNIAAKYNSNLASNSNRMSNPRTEVETSDNKYSQDSLNLLGYPSAKSNQSNRRGSLGKR